MATLADLCMSLTAGSWRLKGLCLDWRWLRLLTCARVLQLVYEVWKAYCLDWRWLRLLTCARVLQLVYEVWKAYCLDWRWLRLLTCAQVLQLVYEVWKAISCIVTDDDTGCWPVHETYSWFMYRLDKSVLDKSLIYRIDKSVVADWTLKTNYLFIPCMRSERLTDCWGLTST